MKKLCYADESLIRFIEEYNLDVHEGNVSKNEVSILCLA